MTCALHPRRRGEDEIPDGGSARVLHGNEVDDGQPFIALRSDRFRELPLVGRVDQPLEVDDVADRLHGDEVRCLERRMLREQRFNPPGDRAVIVGAGCMAARAPSSGHDRGGEQACPEQGMIASRARHGFLRRRSELA